MPSSERARLAGLFAFALSLALPSTSSAEAGPSLPQVGTPDAAVRAEWTFAAGGFGIGLAGLHVADLAGNGERRIVATTAANYWYVLRYEGGAYAQEWVSESYPNEIDALRVANVDADSAQEILVATGARILVYQGSTPTLTREIATPGNVVGLTIADVDRDGALELVFGAAPVDLENRHTLYVLDLASGAVEYQGAGLGGLDVAVGNVDNDADLEIVVASGGGLSGYVLNGRTRALEWTNPEGFGYRVRLGDLDGDGRLEAVTSTEYGFIRVFDIDTRSLSGSIDVSDFLRALRIADVEGDGPLEILYGTSGSVRVLNGQTRALKWEVTNPDSGVSDLAVGDSDGDGKNELVFGGGYSSSGPDHLYVLDAQSHAIEWQSVDLVGPFRLSSGDIDADGTTEILGASAGSDSGAGAGRWLIHDGSTRRLEFQSIPAPRYYWSFPSGIHNANVDADVEQEVFTNSTSAYGGVIVCYDGLTHAEQWRTPAPGMNGFQAFDLGDVDGDGRLELVAAAQGVVYVYDAGTGVLEWQSPSVPLPLSGTLSLLRIANIDADARPEILLANSPSTGALYALDAVARTTEALALPPFTALETFDPDGDGREDLLLGDANGTIFCAVLGGGGVRVLAALGGPEVTAIAAGDLDGQPGLEFVVARANELSIHTSEGALLWRSGVISAGPNAALGAYDGLHVADVDHDGRKEILVTTGSGFQVYEVVSVPQTFASVDDALVSEGNGGKVAQFSVSLSAPSAEPATVSYTTVSGTAAAGADFVAASGRVTFAPGVTSVSVGIVIVGDRIHESDETFELRLSSPEYARLGDATGVATITDDDPPGLSVSSVDLREPESGVAVAQFQVTLSPAWPTEVAVDFATEDATASSPDDYLSASGRLVFAPGEQVKTVPVTVNTDEVTESGETFTLNLARVAGPEIVSGIGLGRIIDKSASLFYSLTPCRLFDSRNDWPLDAAMSTSVQASGRCGVPAGARAVAINITVTAPTSGGHLTVTGDASAPLQTSSLNFETGQTRGNSAVVSLGAPGRLWVSSGQGSGSLHFILDVAGYYQ